MRNIVPYIFVIALALTLESCGGGGGGGSSGGGDSIPGVNSKGNNSFSSSETDYITNGQKHFAFGETATFKSSEAGTWSAKNGSIDSNGVYHTPTELDVYTTDEITFTGDNKSETVSISISPFPKFKNEKYQYDGSSQSYLFTDVSKAVGVAVFNNDTTVEGESNLTTSLTSGKAGKDDQVAIQKKNKLAKLIQNDGRYQCANKRRFQEAIQQSQRQPKKISHKKVAKKSDAAVGSRTEFYHDEGSTKGLQNFELKYKGKKCLIYSEVNKLTDTAYVTTATCDSIGEAFETKNKYHETEMPIFDVVTSVFGNPWGIDKDGNKINSGGRDEDEQIVILLYHGGGLYGYFYWVDEEVAGFKNGDGYVSNGAEIIYLNENVATDEVTILSTLAHEFQHLCDYNQKFILNGEFSSGNFFDASFDEEGPTLFNEGKSVLAEELNGFGLLITKGDSIKGNDFIFQNIDIYRSTISTFSASFLSWGGGSDYGKGYLFWRYIYDTYGEDKLAQMIQSSKLPPTNIEEALGKSFDELLQEFVFALMQADSSTSVNKNIAIKSYDLTTSYVDTKGKPMGKLSPLNYSSGFSGNKIPKNKAWEIRLYKIAPSGGEVNFSVSGLKTQSSFSIFTNLVD